MPSLKRRIAQVRITMRRQQERKEEKELDRIQKKRNADLRAAARSLAKAEANEKRKDAALQKSEANARLNRSKNQTGKNLLSSIRKGLSTMTRELQEKNDKKATRKRTPAKKKTTAKRKTTKKPEQKYYYRKVKGRKAKVKCKMPSTKEKTTRKKASTGRTITINL